MFNQFLKNINNSIESVSIISSISQNQPQKQVTPDSNQDVEKLVQIILKLLTNSISQKIGEHIDENQFKNVASDLMRSKTMENHLIQTKQKYNDLVNKSTNLYQQARKISSYIGDFISSVNVFLESQELLVPLKEIQKGINELQADKVEKQINYLVRIFQNNFEEIIEKKIKSAQLSLQEEIKLLKNLNKNLETEIVSIKNNKNQDQSKYFELNMKISTLNDKIAKLSNERCELEKNLKAELTNGAERQKTILDQEKQINRLKSREAQLLERIKTAQSKINRSQRNLKEQSSESEALNLIIAKLKQKQEQIEEQLEKEYKKKQANNESLRKKLQNQKIYLQEKYDLLNQRCTSLEAALAKKDEQIVKLSKKVKENIERGDYEIDLEPSSKEEIKQHQNEEKAEKIEQKDGSQVEGKHKISVSELMNKLSTLEARNNQLEEKLGKEEQVSVNKQVFKSLFLNYDDQSKEWAVRRNIKHQIYALLDLNDKIPKVQEAKQSKWFGIF